MPFPSNLESLLAAGYTFLRSETCPACREPVEVFTTPGKRTIALNPMCELLRPAVRHYEVCKPSNPTPEAQKPQEQAIAPQQIKLYGVTDKNMIACGWLDGTLAVALRWGTYHHTEVPEDIALSIRRNPYPHSLYVKVVKNHPELYPCTKVG